MTAPILLLDVGNTHAVVGLAIEGRIQATWRISTHPPITQDELHLKLRFLLDQEKRISCRFEDLQAVVVASVVPAWTRLSQRLFNRKNHQPPLTLLDGTSPYSFKNATASPQRVGTDRLVNAEAALHLHKAPVIIVDSGTATTLCALDLIQDEPTYLGGAIVPGLELSMRALAERTAQLHTIELIAPLQAIGRDTTEALQSGLVLGYAELIDGLIRRFRKEMKQPEHLKVVATGGVSPLMKGICQNIDHFDDELTLKGMVLLYDRITGG